MMPLVKAFIINTATSIPIPVMFNPSEYTVEKSNQNAEIGIPGLGSPLIQFVRGNIETLKMDLFFDTYEMGLDVRLFTSLVYGLLKINPSTHAPPVCIFVWGTLIFTCVLDSVTQRFTMFLGPGFPVRATLSVVFKQYTSVEIETRQLPLESADHVKHRVVKQSDSLWSIAYEEYGDPGQWRAIAEANDIEKPRELEPGTPLMIPALK